MHVPECSAALRHTVAAVFRHTALRRTFTVECLLCTVTVVSVGTLCSRAVFKEKAALCSPAHKWANRSG